MWKDYSAGYIKNNRASSMSVMIAAFISALLLSLLCGLFYNLWVYEIERIKAEEGDWQGRIIGEISAEDLDLIQNYANVEKAVLNEECSGEQGTAADIYFKKLGSILTDMPRIAELIGVPADAVTYHYTLLNMYLIRDSNDSALRWIFPFSLMITVIASFSLILIIHNAFAVTMNARIHQFGILSSIGATPKQIRTCLLQEAFVLCAVPIVAGNLFGILICMGIIQGINVLLTDVARRLVLPFSYNPLILLFSLSATVITIWISAWIPARKMSKMTPLEAIKNTSEIQLKRKKNSCILSLLFGVEGELAGNALKAQGKAMGTATLSLIFSFLAFSFSMCFLAIIILSQRETYFERYQDAWDIMVTVNNTEIDAFDRTDALQGLPGVQSGVVYQKAAAKRILTEDEISEESRAIGGFRNASPEYVSPTSAGWLVNVPLVILDDESFLEYCGQIGAKPRLDGAVIRNQICDAADPNFRKRRMLAYLTESQQTTVIRGTGQENGTVEIPVIAYTREVPNLREEYGTVDYYELAHFIPVSVWQEIKAQIGGTEADTYIRILAKDGATLAELNEIEENVSRLLGGVYETEIENRIQDKLNNDNMFRGMKALVSLFCVLLAIIGIGNVFSNTLGFVRQRKREFARYLSVGMTPRGMRKIFCVEALVIAGRPVLITLPITAAAVVFFIKVSYLEPMVVIGEIPFIPILAFILAIFGFVGWAYYLGAKKVLGSNLMDSLRDDTVM